MGQLWFDWVCSRGVGVAKWIEQDEVNKPCHPKYDYISEWLFTPVQFMQIEKLHKYYSSH